MKNRIILEELSRIHEIMGIKPETKLLLEITIKPSKTLDLSVGSNVDAIAKQAAETEITTWAKRVGLKKAGNADLTYGDIVSKGRKLLGELDADESKAIARFAAEAGATNFNDLMTSLSKKLKSQADELYQTKINDVVNANIKTKLTSNFNNNIKGKDLTSPDIDLEKLEIALVSQKGSILQTNKLTAAEKSALTKVVDDQLDLVAAAKEVKTIDPEIPATNKFGDEIEIEDEITPKPRPEDDGTTPKPEIEDDFKLDTEDVDPRLKEPRPVDIDKKTTQEFESAVVQARESLSEKRKVLDFDKKKYGEIYNEYLNKLQNGDISVEEITKDLIRRFGKGNCVKWLNETIPKMTAGSEFLSAILNFILKPGGVILDFINQYRRICLGIAALCGALYIGSAVWDTYYSGCLNEKGNICYCLRLKIPSYKKLEHETQLKIAENSQLTCADMEGNNPPYTIEVTESEFEDKTFVIMKFKDGSERKFDSISGEEIKMSPTTTTTTSQNITTLNKTEAAAYVQSAMALANPPSLSENNDGTFTWTAKSGQKWIIKKDNSGNWVMTLPT